MNDNLDTESYASFAKQHYEQWYKKFWAHYYDSTSLEYQDLFIYPRMFSGIDQKERKVAELFCGGGPVGRFLFES